MASPCALKRSVADASMGSKGQRDDGWGVGNSRLVLAQILLVTQKAVEVAWAMVAVWC